MAIAAVKVIWVSSDDKTGESEVGANSCINALLTRFLLRILWRYWILENKISFWKQCVAILGD